MDEMELRAAELAFLVDEDLNAVSFDQLNTRIFILKARVARSPLAESKKSEELSAAVIFLKNP